MSEPIEARLSKLKQEMDSAQQEKDRLTGRREGLLAELKRLGHASPAAAQEALAETKRKLQAQEEEILKVLVTLEKRYGLAS